MVAVDDGTLTLRVEGDGQESRELQHRGPEVFLFERMLGARGPAREGFRQGPATQRSYDR